MKNTCHEKTQSQLNGIFFAALPGFLPKKPTRLTALSLPRSKMHEYITGQTIPQTRQGASGIH